METAFGQTDNPIAKQWLKMALFFKLFKEKYGRIGGMPYLQLNEEE
jgi:hypothetical protein